MWFRGRSMTSEGNLFPAPPRVTGSPPAIVDTAVGPELVGRFRRFFGRRDSGQGRRDGDRKIQTQLARLARRDARWRVLHGIPVGVNGSPIDHLVIGPGGVYALSAKFHPDGRVWVRGNVFRVDDAAYAHVSNSRHEALRASRCLGAACGFAVSVTGVVVVVGAEHIAVSESPGDVHVVSRSTLRGWLGRRDDVLDAPTIAAVHDAARRPATWVPSV